MVSADPYHTSRSACRVTISRLAGALLLILVTPTVAVAQSTTPGALSAYSTIHSIGIEWNISGDADHDATVQVEYRVQGSGTWKPALPLLRVDYNGRNMLAGSILFLSPGTTYEVKLSLSDPDGGADTRTPTVATRPVPSLPTGGRTFHVVPGAGGGDGSSGNPFKGIGAAQAIAQPKDIFFVHAGNYGGRIPFNRAGTAGGNYIAWKGAGDGEATFYGIDVSASHVWIEGLTVRNQPGYNGGLKSGSCPTNVVVSRNIFRNNHYSVYLNGGGRDWYIADNDIVGDNDPLSGSFSGEGVELALGSPCGADGHILAHNTISRTGDGISNPHLNVDIYGNDIFDVSDNAIESDGGQSNLRMWGNRITNSFYPPLSFQPQENAPWYIVRNQVASGIAGPFGGIFKFRQTDRSVIAHNTFVRWGDIMECCSANIYHLIRSIVKNNLFVSASSGRLYDFGGTSKDWRTAINDNGFDWGTHPSPFTYSGGSYSSLTAFASASGLETSGIKISRSTCFETFNVPSTGIPRQFMTLKPTCNAANAGTILPNINDGFLGAAPDLGAYEVGQPLPIYGPRPLVSDTTPPSIPTGLVATAISSSQINLSWIGSTDNVSVAGYNVYRGGALVGTSSTTVYADMALSPSTLYSYRVAAFDAGGNTSAESTAASATTLAPPPPNLFVQRAPGAITVDGNLTEWIGANSVNFKGLSNGATSFLLWDDTKLYMAVVVTDTQLAALQTVRDDADFWRDDSVEFYIDTLNDRASSMQADDYQLAVNLNNAQADLRGTGSGKDWSWNQTWASAVTRQGTLNSHGDTDTSYVIEMSISWAAIGVTPSAGRIFSIDVITNDSDPPSTPDYGTFDWAAIAPNSYAQPYLWKRVQLTALPPPPAPPAKPTGLRLVGP